LAPGLLLAFSLASVPAKLSAAPLFADSPAKEPAPAGAISLSDYQTRLHSLDQLIATCQSAMTPLNCQSSRVGPDLQVALPTGPRQIRFGWLRALLDQAAGDQAAKEREAKEREAKEREAKERKAKEEREAKAQAAKSPSTQTEKKQPQSFTVENRDYIPPTVAQRLADARKRLAEDEQLTQQQSQQPPRQSAPAPAASTAQRATLAAILAAILAAKEYHTAVAGRSLKQRILEKIGSWINRFLSSLIQAGAKSKWIGITAEIVFVLLISIALVWFLIRLERQSRYTPATLGPGSGAASARDWQLWLEDAHAAAGRAAWRDAIHLLYWASISRLESSGLWPADRTRTPREYLALLARENPQHPGLSALTRSFERTWYAARPASEADFHQAEQLASQLTAQHGARPGAHARARRADNQRAR
jgi:hypothetical protein